MKSLIGRINEKRNISGGGGGTFVVRGAKTPLIIAGGGGGINTAASRNSGCDVRTNTTGNPGYRSWSGGAMDRVQRLLIMDVQVRVHRDDSLHFSRSLRVIAHDRDGLG